MFQRTRCSYYQHLPLCNRLLSALLFFVMWVCKHVTNHMRSIATCTEVVAAQNLMQAGLRNYGLADIR